MILGVLDGAQSHTDLPGVAPAWADRHLSLFAATGHAADAPSSEHPYTNESGDVVLAFRGRLFNQAELRRRLDGRHLLRTSDGGELLVHLYEDDADRFLDEVNGKFAFALWDARRRRLILGRDRLGIEPLVYAEQNGRLVFGSSARALVRAGWVEPTLDQRAMLRYLLYCRNPDSEGVVRGVRQVPPGHLLVADERGTELRPWWRLSFAEPLHGDERECAAQILDLLRDSVRLRLDGAGTPAVLLSGGVDSSALVALATAQTAGPVRTFSFRCAGRSYDESEYARFVAKRFGSLHTEIAFGPADLTLVARAVEAMDEPFCDIGIELATFLLGRAADGQAGYTLSGEGADELFAGHPVYSADRLAAAVDHLPRPLLLAAARLFRHLPDTEAKKSLPVKLRRFAYGVSLPRGLLSHRWRVYYTVAELADLCTPDFVADADLAGLFDGLLAINAEADGPDILSRCLQSDYRTLVPFYLQRLQLLRSFGLDSRTPFLDHRLVEYSAQIPTRLKFRGVGETKLVYRRALETVLPRRILYDRPKLGHSVPLKNWLRDDPAVEAWVRETLTGRRFQERGYFRPGAVVRMLDEHRRRQANHSHRLWALLVLELWMRSWEAETQGLAGSPAAAHAGASGSLNALSAPA